MNFTTIMMRRENEELGSHLVILSLDQEQRTTFEDAMMTNELGPV